MKFIKYIFKIDTMYQVIIAILFVLIILWGSFKPEYVFCDKWGDYIDPLITLFTLVIGMFIWINEKRQDYLETLPKKLDIQIIDESNNCLMNIKNAPLVSQDDIRMWGQQLARQMNNGKELPISGFEILPPNLLNSEGIEYRNYTFKIYLSNNSSNSILKIEDGHEIKREYNMQGKLIVPSSPNA